MGERELVVVTGSSGLIGSATAQRLAPLYDVIGLDSKPPRAGVPIVEHVHIDLTSDDSVATALRYVRTAFGRRLASFIHLAAYYDFSGDPSPLYEQVTVRGTERLLREIRAFEVEQFVFSSSMLVHAPCEVGTVITEDSPLEPKWDYPKSKVDTEQIIREQHGTIPIAILRIAGVYDDRCRSLPIAHQIQRIFERRLISHVFPGDTSHGQAFVHLEDVVDAFAKLVGHRSGLPRELTLLIGEPETMSYEELQLTLGRLIHAEYWETRRIPKSLAKAGAWLQEQVPAGEEPFIRPWMIDIADDHYALGITRAGTILGWNPQRSLRETLPRMVEALEADPVGFYRDNKLEPPSWLERVAMPSGEQPASP